MTVAGRLPVLVSKLHVTLTGIGQLILKEVMCVIGMLQTNKLVGTMVSVPKYSQPEIGYVVKKTVERELLAAVVFARNI